MKTDIIFFSPTGTSASIAMSVADGLGYNREIHNLTLFDDNSEITVKDGIAVFVVPVYAGRVPAVCIDRMKKIKGDKSLAVIAVVYGNRDYEDALIELHDIVTAAGFKVTAAGAFIGEHSYSTDEKPVAKGRPDADDLAMANKFGADCRDKIDSGDVSLPFIKGNRPYKERPDKRNVTPLTDENLCVACGTCAYACPTEAITITDIASSDANKCIICCACIKKCHVSARYIADEGILMIRERLFNNFTARREPEIFI